MAHRSDGRVDRHRDGTAGGYTRVVARSTWILIGTTACTAAPAVGTVEPATTCVAAREPNPPLDIVISPDEFGPPRSSNDVAPEPEPEPEPSFEPTLPPWHISRTVVSERRRGCSVVALTDPEVLVVYSMIDVYSLIAEDLAYRLEPSLPERAEHPPCAGGSCRPGVPNAVLINDGADGPIDGRAIGFVVPIGDGYWVLPLEQAYREDRCMPDVDAETVEDGHARLRIRYQEFYDCDDDDDDPDPDECLSGCFHTGATQYDLFYDAESERALLVTRRHDELDESDEPKPAIEVARAADAVRIDGCKADATIPWPMPRR
jgi:hypothetical protein